MKNLLIALGVIVAALFFINLLAALPTILFFLMKIGVAAFLSLIVWMKTENVNRTLRVVLTLVIFIILLSLFF